MTFARLIGPSFRIAGLLALLVPEAAVAQDTLEVSEIRLDRPTVHALGVQVLITGDDDRDATVGVRHREAGGEWREAPPLFRVHPEDVTGTTVPEQLAGSVFDLRPGTTYEIELHITDPDGLDERRTIMGTTRAIPRANPASPSVVNVSSAAELQSALSGASAGDVIVLADGTYTGSFSINRSGTAEDPIVIRGESQDGVILDGEGCGCNVIEVYGSYVHVEQLTIRNAVRAMRFLGTDTTGNVARWLTIRDVVHGIAQGTSQTDFYICDNDIEGRLAWPWVFDSDWTSHWGDRGITVAGEGHVVCHNRLVGFGDALLNYEEARSYDFYGNEVHESADGTELDRGLGNVRLWGNRFVNVYAGVSIQPVLGGPTYVLRNVFLNVTDEQIKLKMTGSEPSGALVYHNTFVSPERALNLQTPITTHNFVMANNLFVGPTTLVGSTVVDWTATLDDGTFDYNGYYPEGQFWFGRRDGERLLYDSFADAMASGEVEMHGVLVGADVFASGMLVPSGDGSTRVEPFDVALDASSGAVDSALSIPGINAGHVGAGPDMGARELGCTAPVYGPRAPGSEGETNLVDCRAGSVEPLPDGGVAGSDGGGIAVDGSVVPTGDAAMARTDGGTDPGTTTGSCGCRVRSGGATDGLALLAFAALWLSVRRRRRSR